jgi:hypothetical protein
MPPSAALIIYSGFGLGSLTNLTRLDLSACKNIKPKPSPVNMTTRQQVAAYQARIKKTMK